MAPVVHADALVQAADTVSELLCRLAMILIAVLEVPTAEHGAPAMSVKRTDASHDRDVAALDIDQPLIVHLPNSLLVGCHRTYH